MYTPNYSQNYPNNYDAIWFIRVAPDETISFSFATFDVEPDVRCSHDYVYLYEGVVRNPEEYYMDGP